MENFDVQIKKLIIPAAGAGTRLLPITKVTPKELLRLVDKPVSWYLVDEAYESGIRHIIFIINPWKKEIQKYFCDSSGESILKEFPGLKFSFIETNERFGDGHAIFLASRMINKKEAFAVTMGDLLSPSEKPFLKQLAKVFKKYQKPVISVEHVSRRHVDRYGIISPKSSIGRVFLIGDIVEKPPVQQAPSNLAMTGKYILTPEIFDYLDRLLKNRKKGQEIRLADALKEYSHERELLALECSGRHFDTGNKIGFLKTEVAFGLKHPEIRKEFKKYLKTVI